MASPFGTYSDATSLAEALAHLCEDPHPDHNGWRARCPNHQGKSDTSLSITPADDRVLLHCFAECPTVDIVHALGLTMTDLFVTQATHSMSRKRIIMIYDYYDANGTLVFQTVRYEPKDFKQRRPDPARPGEWIWNLKTIDRVLYNLPAVMQAIHAGITVYICEGEKDADALIERGLVATTCPLGAKKWQKRYTDTLRHAHVVLLPDNDGPGHDHVAKIATALHGIAASIKIVTGLYTDASGSDISDWLKQGGTREAFDTAVAATPTYDASAAVTSPPPPTMPPAILLQPSDDCMPLPYSDYTNALALIQDYGNDLHYIHPWKSWLVWQGTHWERDTSGAVMRYAKHTIKRLASSIADLDDDEAKALLKHVKASLATNKLEAMVRNAQSELPIPSQPEQYDADPWLLNCLNGTLNLHTGMLGPHHPGDRITKCLPIAYDAQATCPAWLHFLWRIMGGSAPDTPDLSMAELEARHGTDIRAHELIGFLQRAIGYSLTGSTQEQCIFILHGPTKTGKSTFLATLRALFGPYGQQADMASFMHKERDEVRNDLADLAGSRFVCALESQEGKRLAESLVKQLTGGTDFIKARFLFQEYFTFKPQFKIFIGTNHKPIIKETDSAIWERIRLVPFTAPIPLDERDKTLDARLQQELPGILAWAIRGCLEWQRQGALGEPEAVQQATAEYKEEQDALALFFADCCLLADAVTTKSSALYKAYQDWCEANGERTPLTQRSFGLRLAEKNFKPYTNNGRWWRGIGLHMTQDTHKTSVFDSL